jgi:hypothetical protein
MIVMLKFLWGFLIGSSSQGADPPPPPPLNAREGRLKSCEQGNHPPPPHWDKRAIQTNHIKFKTCSAFAAM